MQVERLAQRLLHGLDLAGSGIPHPEPAAVRDIGHQLNAHLDVSSNFTNAGNGAESIVIDGETYRITLRGVFGLGNGWETGLELPVIKHSGGFLDSFIVQWHDFFGLPQLGRDQVANNQLRYQYQYGNQNRVDISAGDTGLGDVVLFAGKRLPVALRTALRMQIKLPTGRPAGLFGSGGTDLALMLQSDYALNNDWRVYGGLGGAYLGRGEVLPELQREWAGFGNMGIVWQPADRVAFQVQFAGQTPVYKDTDLHQLNDSAVQSTLGGTLKFADGWYLDLGVTEDEWAYDVSPDISFHIRLRHNN